LTYRLIDLFSGAGGLSLGFKMNGLGRFMPVWANDFNRAAAATYNANFGDHCTTADIVDLLKDSRFRVPQADVVIGGPPCQGFSLLNKKRNLDPRKALWGPFMEVVERSRAVAFVMENVSELVSSPEYSMIERKALRLGFQVAWAVLNAADYGTPQRRRRAIIFGVKKRNPSLYFPPHPTHCAPNILERQLELGLNGGARKPWSTVKDAIGDLPRPAGVEIRTEAGSPLDLHFGRRPRPESLERYKIVSKEGMNRFDLQREAPHLTPACWIRKKKGGTDLFGRLWWKRPAFTIRTEFYKPEKGRYLHPSQHRPITHREAARLQGFPDDFDFKGSKIEIAKQIGNAVPLPLATAIAKCMVKMLRKEYPNRGRRIHQKKTQSNHELRAKHGYKTGKNGKKHSVNGRLSIHVSRA